MASDPTSTKPTGSPSQQPKSSRETSPDPSSSAEKTWLDDLQSSGHEVIQTSYELDQTMDRLFEEGLKEYDRLNPKK